MVWQARLGESRLGGVRSDGERCGLFRRGKAGGERKVAASLGETRYGEIWLVKVRQVSII